MEPEIRTKVENFLSDVKQIPTLPDVYMRVKKAFEDPSVSVEYLADAIRYDQSLTISILRLANSPFFGFKQKISSINQAVMLVGLREVYSLVLSVSVMGIFPAKDDKEEEFFPVQKFWEHSLGVAIAARTLGTMMNYPHPEELFVAGLIHDIGKMIEKLYLGDKFKEVCKKSKEQSRPLRELEMEVLGFTHSEVGQVLAEQWQFPNFLVQTTAHHHSPSLVEDPLIADGVAVVHVADSLIKGLELGWSGDPFIPSVEMEALKRLHLVPFNELDVIISKIKEEYLSVVNILMG